MVSRKKRRYILSNLLTCDAVDRADGENALAALTASANNRTDLENIIVYLFYIIFRIPRRCICCTVLILVREVLFD